MSRFHPGRFSWVLALTLVFWAVVVQAQEFHYRYVSLDQVAPPGFTTFVPTAINDSGRVYGYVAGASALDFHIAFYKDGTLTVLQSPYPAIAYTVNAGGTVLGLVLVDLQNFIAQLALLRGDHVQLIPGSEDGFPIALNDRGTALFEAGLGRYSLYSNGQTSPLNFGPTVTHPAFISPTGNGRFINNKGIIAGTEYTGSVNDRGFRFDPRSGEATLLQPVPPDTRAWGLGINNNGDVLGYSFVSGAPYHERIGVWDRTGNFATWFDETIPTSSLLFNDNNLIVITFAPGNNSYLVPRPGVRLNLADLVENLPADQDLQFIFGLNNHGDMLGTSSGGNNFLLERVGVGNQ